MSFENHPINVLNRKGAPDFVTLDAAILLEQAIQAFETETGRTLSPSQVEMYLLETMAYLLTLRGAQEQLALENGYVAFARSEFLDKHGVDRNTPRLAAMPAKTELRFEADAPVNQRIHIPAGTRVSDAIGQEQFLTSLSSYIEAGESYVDVAAQAAVEGIGGNGFASGILTSLIDPVDGITQVSNLTETGGGANVEADDRYRARLALAFERVSRGGSRENYEAIVLGWNSRVIDVAVLRPQAGYIHIHPLMEGGVPNEQEKSDLLAYLRDKIPMGDLSITRFYITSRIQIRLVDVIGQPKSGIYGFSNGFS